MTCNHLEECSARLRVEFNLCYNVIMAGRSKMAIFDLTGCEGCEFHLLSLNEELLDLFQNFEISHWRLMDETEKNDFDIAIIEGAVTTQEQIGLLKQIRETAKIVIALGACAISGNIFHQLNPDQRQKLAAKIYDQDYQLKAKFLEPVAKFIKVDYQVPGCPPDIAKFKKLLAKFKKEPVISKIQDVTPPEYVAKIEGHGRLKINFQQKKVSFQVEESERLVEGLLLGKGFDQAPQIVSRICGICPVAHHLCAWKALEDALGMRPSPEAIKLREIMACSQIVKSHLLHLFFLVLPDFAGGISGAELPQKYPAEFHLMLNLKRVSEAALAVVAGSTAFPTNLGLAGFLKVPVRPQLIGLRDQINEVVDEAEDLIELFASFEVPQMSIKTDLLTITPPSDQYPLYQGALNVALRETVRGHSTAKFGLLADRQVVKVGALARLAHFGLWLNPMARQAYKKYQFNLANPFNNNLAQAVEVLHFLEQMRFGLESLFNARLRRAKAKSVDLGKFPARGEASLEAPRGSLIHQVALDREGKITRYNIIPPTQINLSSLEKETRQLVKSGGRESDVEKLIRAFDPCITCAVH